jgi:hypothetical protein
VELRHCARRRRRKKHFDGVEGYVGGVFEDLVDSTCVGYGYNPNLLINHMILQKFMINESINKVNNNTRYHTEVTTS